jgi:hypothetical protein
VDKICGQTAATHYAALEALKTTRRVWLAPRVSSLCGAAVGSNPAALHSPTARLQWLTRVYNELSTVGGCGEAPAHAGMNPGTSCIRKCRTYYTNV